MGITHRIRVFFNNRFIKNISILVGGTAFSQLITLMALPILTRIYSPEDFTVLAAYTSILGLIASIACLRFEIAIPLPKKDEDAIQVLALSLLSLTLITILTVFTIVFFTDELNKITNERMSGYFWLLPIGVFFGGLYSSLAYWMIRSKRFSIIARTRMTQATSGAVTQIGSGYLGLTPFGLLLGQVLNTSAGIISFLKSFTKDYRELLGKIRLKKIIIQFNKYERFPKYSTWEALTNSAGIQVPILIIASLAIGSEAGFLMLAMRVLSAPLGLIGKSVSQVYLSEASDKYHEGTLREFTIKTILMLAKVGIAPILIAGILAPFIVPIVFGENWFRAGILISWMTPWFFIQFITSPVSMALHVTNSQKTALSLQISGLILRGGSVYFAALYYNHFVSEVYAISGFIFYTVYLLIVLKVIAKSSHGHVEK